MRLIPDLDRVTAEIFAARLAPGGKRPIAVAFSGGGDSLALLLVAAAWAEHAKRRLLVLTVDHRLQPQSAAWTQACAVRAAALGAGFRPLVWEGPKPARGLPAAARAARHKLLAEAARNAGARVILMGHTADDALEARAMRAGGATTPEPRLWAPSPVWPEGRGIFLLRPLLKARRAQIRRWLETRGEAWIDDPANLDMRYARARARRDLQDVHRAPPRVPCEAPALAKACRMGLAGELVIAREKLRRAPPAKAAAFVSAACLCAAGTARPPAGPQVAGLLAKIIEARPFTAALAGARIEAEAGDVRFLREPGEFTRRPLAPLSVATGETAVWDGRFEITAPRALEVRPLAGLVRRLREDQRQTLAAIPAKARPTLPAWVDQSGLVTCLAFDETAAQPLAHARLLAALGAIEREPP